MDSLFSELFVIISLIIDLTNLTNYLNHKKLLSEDERCKFLKINEDYKSKCSHPSHKRLFKNGSCPQSCSKRLGENVDLSTFDALLKENGMYVFKLILWYTRSDIIKLVIL